MIKLRYIDFLRCDPVYRLRLTIHVGKTNKTHTFSIDKGATEFYSTKGVLQKENFEAFFENFISSSLSKIK